MPPKANVQYTFQDYRSDEEGRLILIWFTADPGPGEDNEVFIYTDHQTVDAFQNAQQFKNWADSILTAQIRGSSKLDGWLGEIVVVE